MKRMALLPKRMGARLNRDEKPARLSQQRGLEHHLAGRLAEALDCYNAAVKAELRDPDLFYNRALLHHNFGDFERAVGDYDEALALDPCRAEAWENRGVALHKLKRPLDAISSYERALKFASPTAQLLANQGVSLYSVYEFDRALHCYAEAESLNPSYAPLYNNRGNLFRLIGRFDEAIANFDRALALQVNYAEAWGNRAAALHEAGRLNEAREAYDVGLARFPGHAEIRWNRSLLMLLTGDYARGWAEYESRWSTATNEADRHLNLPKWLGENDLAGKSLLVYPEQGLGDFLQFVRYLPQLIARGVDIVLETPKPLLPLIATMQARFPVERLQLIARDEALPHCDARIPIMSLPLALRSKVYQLPAEVPYLAAPESNLQVWQHKLGPRTRRRVGLAWSGSPTHRNDFNRSLVVEALTPLLDIDCEFHCLQAQIRDRDTAWMENHPSVVRHDHDLKDFADTAALVQLMDVVVSVDTSVAHLAGALGRPVWIMLPYSPDFRWMLRREDSPWYPSAQLFRQPQPGIWQPVIERIATALSAYCG